MKKNRIIWSPLATETYLEILNYLLAEWNIQIANEFDKKVESLLTSISKYEALCPVSKQDNSMRRCVISKQISMIYRVKGDVIEIISFYDNRQG